MIILRHSPSVYRLYDNCEMYRHFGWHLRGGLMWKRSRNIKFLLFVGNKVQNRLNLIHGVDQIHWKHMVPFSPPRVSPVNWYFKIGALKVINLSGDGIVKTLNYGTLNLKFWGIINIEIYINRVSHSQVRAWNPRKKTKDCFVIKTTLYSTIIIP